MSKNMRLTIYQDIYICDSCRSPDEIQQWDTYQLSKSPSEIIEPRREKRVESEVLDFGALSL